MIPDVLRVDFASLMPWAVLAVLAALALGALGFGLLRSARGVGWRALALAVIFAALANPVLVEEEREALPDIAAIVVDKSPSQAIGDRPRQTAATLAHVKERLSRLEDLEVRVIEAGAPSEAATTGPADGTRLFSTIAKALSDVPRKRMAGTILITDGQVHDVPKAARAEGLPFAGPLHVLISGARGENDRRLVIEQAPSYGIVGKEVEIRVRIEDTAKSGGQARLRLVIDGGAERVIGARIGETSTISIKLEHAGPNIAEIAADAGESESELTLANNRAVVAVNGVRERLRVLLVSGEPHPGGRVWRNLLKADPSVDLVHFTILRPPEKQDSTPVHELSLIAFPIRELFEVKLDEFDLIIFDRYRRRGVLPPVYLRNIARYVEEGGGAVLEAVGPEFATPLSLFRTPLGNLLPGAPTGVVYQQGLRPRLAATGRRHPVSAELPGDHPDTPRWGRWFRQIEVSPRRGMVLMEGISRRPLLIVDRVGKGRVGQILSDHIWLWSRGFEGGGPHSELLRRLAHWLMKEPDLEENDLSASYQGNRLRIVRRSIKPDLTPVRLTAPSGAVETITLKEDAGGRSIARVLVKETGLYRVSDGTRTALAAVGTFNPLEYADLRATDQRLKGLVKATRGGTAWIAEHPAIELRRVRPGRTTAGRGWFGLVANRDYMVRSVTEAPLMPSLLLLLFGLGALMLAWHREGR